MSATHFGQADLGQFGSQSAFDQCEICPVVPVTDYHRWTEISALFLGGKGTRESPSLKKEGATLFFCGTSNLICTPLTSLCPKHRAPKEKARKLPLLEKTSSPGPLFPSSPFFQRFFLKKREREKTDAQKRESNNLKGASRSRRGMPKKKVFGCFLSLLFYLDCSFFWFGLVF